MAYKDKQGQMFKTKLRRIGNSLGVLIPKHVITGLGVGDDIVITIGDVITPSDTLKQPSAPHLKDVGRFSFATADTVTAKQLCRYCGLPIGQPSAQCSRHSNPQ